MGRVLAISSQVARGHVGLSAIVPALQALGHEVIALPTILLSNHPGHPRFAGERVAPDLLRRMFDALESNRWLGEIDAVLTGYLPSAAHVAVACEIVTRVRTWNVRAIHLCDPVIGDDPKGVYIEHDAATAIRDTLLPGADAVRLNAFELGWLTGTRIGDELSAVSQARILGRQTVIVSSVAARQGVLSNVLVPRSGIAMACRVPQLDGVPNGTGDLLSALLLGHALTDGALGAAALSAAISDLEDVVVGSHGASELRLVEALRGLPSGRLIDAEEIP